MGQIVYSNKSDLEDKPGINIVNKIVADDMNEIKAEVNDNDARITINSTNIGTNDTELADHEIRINAIETDATITKEGNTFNGDSQLLKTGADSLIGVANSRTGLELFSAPGLAITGSPTKLLVNTSLLPANTPTLTLVSNDFLFDDSFIWDCQYRFENASGGDMTIEMVKNEATTPIVLDTIKVSVTATPQTIIIDFLPLDSSLLSNTDTISIFVSISTSDTIVSNFVKWTKVI